MYVIVVVSNPWEEMSTVYFVFSPSPYPNGYRAHMILRFFSGRVLAPGIKKLVLKRFTPGRKRNFRVQNYKV